MTKIRVNLEDIRTKVDFYHAAGRFEAAEKLLRATQDEHGLIAVVSNLLGVTYHRQSKFVEAIAFFTEALQENPGFIEAGLNLSATLLDLGRYQDAEQIFNALNEQFNSSKKHPALVLGRLANLHVNSGRSYEMSGMLSEAIAEYRKAVGLRADMPEVRLDLAKLYFRSGQLEKAKQELEDLLKHDRDHAAAHTWLGLLYYKLGKKELSRNHWEKAQNLAPEDQISRAYLKVSREWAAL